MAAGSVPSVVTIYAVTISSVIMNVFGYDERSLSIGRGPAGSVCSRYQTLNVAR